jgi:predicted Zn-dependent protease with MMP-like domain
MGPETANAHAKFAPTLDEIADLAEQALQTLPLQFRRAIEGVALSVDEFADDETLDEMGIEDPFELTGLYRGVPIGLHDSAGPMHDVHRIFLYRRPILDEWCATGVELAHLVRHVLIHEIGHHLGLSDDDIHRIETAEP